MIHSTVCTIFLFIGILTDPVLRAQRPLHPHHNLLGYIGISLSLGYFTFTIPWSYRLYWSGERHATNFALCFHHGVVYVAALTYLIGRTCALYGATAFAAMEFTNWFFIPHILQQQVRSTRHKLWNANYIVLVIAFIAMRLVLCTWMMVLFAEDLGRFQSDDAGEWFLVVFQFVIFVVVTLLSWVWLWQGIQDLDLIPQIKKKLGMGQPGQTTSTRKQSRLPAGGGKAPAKEQKHSTPTITASSESSAV